LFALFVTFESEQETAVLAGIVPISSISDVKRPCVEQEDSPRVAQAEASTEQAGELMDFYLALDEERAASVASARSTRRSMPIARRRLRLRLLNHALLQRHPEARRGVAASPRSRPRWQQRLLEALQRELRVVDDAAGGVHAQDLHA
jgi:hypothetical protein